MKLQENIQRIQEMMGLITEESITFKIDHTFHGDNGDRTHAFQSTNKKPVGNMQTMVNKKLKEMYDAGYNPDVKSVVVTIDLGKKTTRFVVTIGESQDGKAYLGIVTVGSCCNMSYVSRADDQVREMLTWNAKPEEHKLITILESKPDGSSNGGLTIIGGKYKLRQHFYKYTKTSKPPHRKNTTTSKK